jgi:hypothetical protein
MIEVQQCRTLVITIRWKWNKITRWLASTLSWFILRVYHQKFKMMMFYSFHFFLYRFAPFVRLLWENSLFGASLRFANRFLFYVRQIVNNLDFEKKRYKHHTTQQNQDMTQASSSCVCKKKNIFLLVSWLVCFY